MSRPWAARVAISCLLACLTGCAGGTSPRVASTRPIQPESTPAAPVAIAATTAPATRVVNSDAAPRETLPFLASDDLEGRGVGLPGLDRAADLIAGEFTASGLSPLPGQADYFERFDYTASTAPGAASALAIDGKTLACREDFIPFSFSAQKKFSGPVVFVGYGISAPESGYDDYANIDVKGKIVLAMRYEPMDEQGKSRMVKLLDTAAWTDHATFAAKARAAVDHGAAALIIVTAPGPGADGDKLVPFSGSLMTKPVDIPILNVKLAAAEELFQRAGGPDIAQLKAGIDAKFSPASKPLAGTSVAGNVAIDHLVAHVKNVIGYIPGKGPHADEYVVVGAHYDHLGRGALGNQFGPVGSIYHGADDNASGTSVVIELASRMAQQPAPARSIIFMCFTAEEEGLIGSAYFVNHPLVPLDKIVAMVNLDMVGRMENQTLYVGGAGTAADFDAILKSADDKPKLELKSIGRGGLGPSDHMSFAQKHIPVLFFFTGLHQDYHRPTDVTEKINFTGIDEVVDLTQAVLTGMTTMPRDPYLVQADKDSMSFFGSGLPGSVPTRRVLLGIIPDFASTDSRVGVLISGTTPGTPAANAGLQPGDLIVQFGTHKLENLMDLTQALGDSKPGDTVKLIILRGSKTLNYDVTLAERKGEAP